MNKFIIYIIIIIISEIDLYYINASNGIRTVIEMI